jgi:choline dehydrogenase
MRRWNPGVATASRARGYDVAIIGGGSAGAIVANRLSADGSRSVVLVEAGPDFPTPESLPPEVRDARASGASIASVDEPSNPFAWHFVAQGSPAVPAMSVISGRLTGGSTAINGQVFMRGIPDDYDGWARAGNDGWSFAEILRYLNRLERDLDFGGRFHGADGLIRVHRHPCEEWTPLQSAFYEACLAQGFPGCPDVNDPDATGVAPIAFCNVGGVRSSTAATYLDTARDRPNLAILPNRVARRLRFRGARAVGVELDDAVIVADQFVVCSGVWGSPLLLLRSGVGPAAQLQSLGIAVAADLPGVGRNLQDHVAVSLLWRAAEGFDVPAPLSPRIQVSLRYATPSSGRRNEMATTISHVATVSRSGPAPKVAMTDRVKIGAGLYHADSRGLVELVSADPRVPPRIDFRFFSEVTDRVRVREATRLVADIARRPALAGQLGERLGVTDPMLECDAELDKWIAHAARSGLHSVGTCTMGPASDPDAVVDAEGLVRGFENLRVIDASIMPRIVRANVNVSVQAIAERLSEFV